MKLRRFKININEIIPQQHYLSKVKLERVSKSFDEYDSYGDIFVIEYQGSVFSVDGHHRLFHLYNQGVKEIEVVNEIDDNSNMLYLKLADEASQLGLKTIADLQDRILDTEEEYQCRWIDRCQRILKNLDSQ